MFPMSAWPVKVTELLKHLTRQNRETTVSTVNLEGGEITVTDVK